MTTRKQSDEARVGRIRRVVGKVSVVIVAVLVGLLIFEIFLRILGYTYPVFYAPDPDLGYTLRAGMEGWYRKEGEAFVRINSDGLRDDEHPRQKLPNSVRIAIVGDSFAEAMQVSQDSTFWSLIEGRLSGCERLGGKNVEVINFGVSGYGTAQELIMLRKRVFDFSPDVVLLAFTTNNDVTDNSRSLKGTDEIPYFVVRDGTLQLDDSFKSASTFRLRQSLINRAGRFFRDNLRVVQAIHQGHGALKSAIARRAKPPEQARITQEGQVKQSSGGDSPEDANDAGVGELGLDNLIYREPSTAVWTEAWDVTERLILMMKQEVEQRGARFFVVTMSNGIQVHPEPDARKAFMQRLGVETLFYPDLRIKSLGEREGFAVLNLAQELQTHAEKSKVYLHGFGNELGNGHWNEQGHAIAGEILSRKLCEHW